MTVLLAVDPSLRRPGAALFRGGGLIAAASFPVETHPDPLVRVQRGFFAIQAWIGTVTGYLAVDEVITEWPQTDERTRRMDPADLFGLAGLCGRVAALAYQAVASATPSEWTGGVPKARTGDPLRSPRGALIVASVTPAELVLLADIDHDALDAVGLGLWRLGRLVRPGKRSCPPDAPGVAVRASRPRAKRAKRT